MYKHFMRSSARLCGRAQNIFHHHSLSYHVYADDIQIYTSFKPNQSNAASAIHNIETCVQDVHNWLNSHSLK